MSIFIVVLAICCLTVGHLGYQSHDIVQLDTVPAITNFLHLDYPQFAIQDLGEYVYGLHEPEVITIMKTVEANAPSPYPVKFPQNIPYPVASKVPQVIPVAETVKVSQSVPVEVVKPVAVPKSDDESYGIQKKPLEHAEQKLSVDSDNEKTPVSSTSLSTQNDGHQSDWQGISSTPYNSPLQSFAPQHSFAQQEDYSNSFQQNVSERSGHHDDETGAVASSSDVQKDQSTKETVQENVKQPQV